MPPIDPRQMIDAIASKQMGVPPQMPAEGAPPGDPAAAAAPQEKPKADTRPTDNEKAQKEGAPDTEGTRMSADAIMYEIDFDGENRKLTPQQIKETFSRYAGLNHMQAQMKPVLSMVQDIMKGNPDATPEKIAMGLKQALKHAAGQKQMGGTDTQDKPSQPPQRSAEDISKALKQWESDNAATLPPGYREMMEGNANTGSGMKAMQEQLAQTQRMLQAVLAQSQGMTEASKEGVKSANSARQQAMKQQVANNLNKAQQQLQLADEQAQDFMTFAAERGFGLEDFIDPDLTTKVMSDFKNTAQSPEMDRLREIAMRRQAFTGSLGASPSTGGGAGAQPAENSTLNRLVNKAMGG